MDMLQPALIVNLIGTLFLVLLNIDLAERKGRKKELWFFLTLIFGVFATVMLVLADKVESRPAEPVKD